MSWQTMLKTMTEKAREHMNAIKAAGELAVKLGDAILDGSITKETALGSLDAQIKHLEEALIALAFEIQETKKLRDEWEENGTSFF